MSPRPRPAPPQPSDLDQLVAATAARVADATIAALRNMFSEPAIRGVIEREAKIAVQAVLLAETERIRTSAPVPPVAFATSGGLTPLAYRPKKACEILGVSMGTLHKMIADGRLGARKIGSATVVRKDDIDAYLAGLPPTPAAAKAPKGKA